MILLSNLEFLTALKVNNNREWFNMNRSRYEQEHATISAFAEQLLSNLNKHDVIETPSGKKSLYRIYRDVRFSKDKTPYQTYWGGGFKRASKYRRGGYYYHIEHGNSMVIGGFWGPNAKDLRRVRDDIALDASSLRAIITSPSFIEHFQMLSGNQLKVAPNGFDADHPDIDLLRYKQFLLVKRFTDEEVVAIDFAEKIDEAFKMMRPFFNYMSEVLTTDVNGEELP